MTHRITNNLKIIVLIRFDVIFMVDIDLFSDIVKLHH